MVNYASEKVGAEIVASSPGLSNTDNLLGRGPDHYAMMDCAKDKWVVINLGDDIHVEFVVVSNKERHASSVHRFRVWLSSEYPTDSWAQIGYFEADDSYDDQAFEVENTPRGRFIKVEWVDHHGYEDICTMTSIRVYGSTMMQKLEMEIDQEARQFDLESVIDEDPEFQQHLDAVAPAK